MPRVGVMLSGCGVNDGAEIHESVLTLLALDRSGAEIVCLAPDVECDVVNHLTGESTGEKRNVLEEAARIARGDVRDAATVPAADLDALIFPGGFGAAKNLCTFAADGADCTVNPEVSRLVKELVGAGKPIGVICIAPALLAKIFSEIPGRKVRLTIGCDAATNAQLEKMGAEPVDQTVEEVVVDRENKVVSTPAYMLARGIGEAATGIEKCVREVLALV